MGGFSLPPSELIEITELTEAIDAYETALTAYRQASRRTPGPRPARSSQVRRYWPEKQMRAELDLLLTHGAAAHGRRVRPAGGKRHGA
jgi:hypothetical protein